VRLQRIAAFAVSSLVLTALLPQPAAAEPSCPTLSRRNAALLEGAAGRDLKLATLLADLAQACQTDPAAPACVQAQAACALGFEQEGPLVHQHNEGHLRSQLAVAWYGQVFEVTPSLGAEAPHPADPCGAPEDALAAAAERRAAAARHRQVISEYERFTQWADRLAADCVAAAAPSPEAPSAPVVIKLAPASDPPRPPDPATTLPASGAAPPEQPPAPAPQRSGPSALEQEHQRLLAEREARERKEAEQKRARELKEAEEKKAREQSALEQKQQRAQAREEAERREREVREVEGAAAAAAAAREGKVKQAEERARKEKQAREREAQKKAQQERIRKAKAQLEREEREARESARRAQEQARREELTRQAEAEKQARAKAETAAAERRQQRATLARERAQTVEKYEAQRVRLAKKGGSDKDKQASLAALAQDHKKQLSALEQKEAAIVGKERDDALAAKAFAEEESARRKKADRRITEAGKFRHPRARSSGALGLAVGVGAAGAPSQTLGGLTLSARQAVWLAPPLEGMPSGFELALLAQGLDAALLGGGSGTEGRRLIGASSEARLWLGRWALGGALDLRELGPQAPTDPVSSALRAGPAVAVALVDSYSSRVIIGARWLPLLNGGSGLWAADAELAWGYAVAHLQAGSVSPRAGGEAELFTSVSLGARLAW
jgi:hypothetical protein